MDPDDLSNYAQTLVHALRTLAMTAVVIGVPIASGALLGALLARAHRGRVAGAGWAIACLLVPAAAVAGVLYCFPIVGIWDGILVSALVGLGVLVGGHDGLRTGRQRLLLGGSIGFGLLLLEAGTRLFLPPPPPMGDTGDPHFFLLSAMRSESLHFGWDFRARELVCAISYGDAYRGVIGTDDVNGVVFPSQLVRKPDATRRVLHVGDSMVFGISLPREQTFVADLNRIEPQTQHINAGVPGTAPDSYLAVLEAWLKVTDVNLVVMHITEGNDLEGMDNPFGCCHWGPLYSYDAGAATRRCPSPTPIDFSRPGLQWLIYNSPPPFPAKVLAGASSAATYVVAAVSAYHGRSYFNRQQYRDLELRHLEDILRTARDELRARRIPFVVDILPERLWLEMGHNEPRHAPEIAETARRLGIPVIDAAEPLAPAVDRGEVPFLSNTPLPPRQRDQHFNERGHQIMAEWLHEVLPRALATSR